jgi:hypothetical protein
MNHEASVIYSFQSCARRKSARARQVRMMVVVDEAAALDAVGPRAAKVRVLDSESSLALSSFQLSLATTPPGALEAAAFATAVRLTAALPLETVPSSWYMATVARAILRFSSSVLGLCGGGLAPEDEEDGGRGRDVGGVVVEVVDRVDPGVDGLPAAAVPVASKADGSSSSLAAFHAWACSRLDPGLAAGGLVMMDPSAGMFLPLEAPVLGVVVFSVFFSFLVLAMMGAKRVRSRMGFCFENLARISRFLLRPDSMGSGDGWGNGEILWEKSSPKCV